jgi:hypothetical protein
MLRLQLYAESGECYQPTKKNIESRLFWILDLRVDIRIGSELVSFLLQLLLNVKIVWGPSNMVDVIVVLPTQ